MLDKRRKIPMEGNLQPLERFPRTSHAWPGSGHVLWNPEGCVVTVPYIATLYVSWDRSKGRGKRNHVFPGPV